MTDIECRGKRQSEMKNRIQFAKMDKMDKMDSANFTKEEK